MTIDATVPNSVGWWMQRLWTQLLWDQKRFAILEAYASGQPPLAWGSKNIQSAFFAFQKTSRTNFADLIVDAPCRRVRMRSVATAADDDANGDPTAWALLRANGMQTGVTRLSRLAKKFGRAYIATAIPDVDGGPALMTVEDPRQMITEAHPVMPTKVRAAFKLFYDPEASLDVAILWLPGHKYVATRSRNAPRRQTRSAGLIGQPEPYLVRFSPSSFDLRSTDPADPANADGFHSEEYDELEIPVDPVFNKDGVGEFELHTDMLDRINHATLQYLVIATNQAFRQRSLEATDGNTPALPKFDEAGNEIDYSSVFEAGPDALWSPPPGWKVTELGQADMQGILQAIKDEVLRLSAVTSTPVSIFTPDAVSQSAEGAQNSRMEMSFKVQEFEGDLDLALSRATARCFRFMGDDSRADASRTEIRFEPVDVYSLAEMGSASAQAADTLPFESRLELIWQMTPAQIEAAKQQRQEDMVFASQVAAINAANAARTAAQVPTPTQASPDGNVV